MPDPRRRRPWSRLALVAAAVALLVAALPAAAALSAQAQDGQLCFTVTSNVTTVDGGTSALFWVDGNEDWTGADGNVCVNSGWHSLTAKEQTASPWQRGADLTFDGWFWDVAPLDNRDDLTIWVYVDGSVAGTTYTIYYADCCPPPGA